jgi:hypothetical protein
MKPSKNRRKENVANSFAVSGLTFTVGGTTYTLGNTVECNAAAYPGSASTLSAAMMPTREALARMKQWMADFEDDQARRFNDAVKAAGFDLDRGDMMIVPPRTDLGGVPERYRAQVRESVLADRAYLMRNPHEPFTIDRSTE